MGFTMKVFVDTADSKIIANLSASGLIDGVTTNPSLVAQTQLTLSNVVTNICEVCPGPVSAEVMSTDQSSMWREAKELASIAANVVVKIPLTQEGMWVVRQCAKEGIQTNVTLCFSPLQALMAAKAGATYVSPFIGRIDDLTYNGLELIQQMRTIFDNYKFPTQILSASVRTLGHVRDVALMGSDAVTIPPKVIEQMLVHPLTNKGLEAFMRDAAKIPS